MPFLKLNEQQIQMFQDTPESAMDIHVVKLADVISVVVGCTVLIVADSGTFEQASALLRGNALRDIDQFEKWRHSLGNAPELEPLSPVVARMIVNTNVYLPPSPKAPPYVYGHLPFPGSVQANDIVYRCECWPTSRRIDLKTGNVAAGTFTFPASELMFVPTGFSAVGRYALPSLPPACHRYELRPPANTPMYCGASVPLFGQAGGGVEILFHRGFFNSGPIAPPVVLPAL